MVSVLSRGARGIAVAVLVGGVFASQYWYGVAAKNLPVPQGTVSLRYVKSFDLGLHSAVASFLWINTRTEVPFLRDGWQKFRDDLALINDLDPRFSYPYVYTTLVLPISLKYPDRIAAAVEVGKRGIANADSDWRLPFYVAALYHIEFKDQASAAKYFDLAAQTPGIPDLVRGFAINYGVIRSNRERTKQIWMAIAVGANDEATRERARAYVAHFEIFDALERAAHAYKEKFGSYPKDVNDLVAKKIISQIPADPFGYSYRINRDGTADVK